MFGSRLISSRQWLARARPLRVQRGKRKAYWTLRRPVLGVEIRGSSLLLACVRPRWEQRWLLGTGVISDFRQLSGDQLRAGLQEFLQPLAVEEPRLVLGLPRKDVIVRLLELPQAAGKSLPQALEFQLALYQPNEEDEFCWDAAVVSAKEHLASHLVLLPRRGLEHHIKPFAEAGYPVSRLTVGQFALLDLVSRSPQAAMLPKFLYVHFKGENAELAVVHRSQLVYSRSFALVRPNLAPEQVVVSEIHQALATLRWNDVGRLPILQAGLASEGVGQALTAWGPVQRIGSWCQAMDLEGQDREEFWGPVALALEDLSWFGSYGLNLLPGELRPPRRHWQFAPTYGLLAANAILLLALGVRAPVQERLLLKEYRHQIAQLERSANQWEELLETHEKLRKQLDFQREFQARGRQPLEALREIAERLPPDTWLNQYSYRQGQVELVGVAKSASSLLAVLEASPQFAEVKFSGGLTREASGMERFRLQMRVEGSQ